MTPMYIPFYSVDRMPDAETTPVLQIPHTHMNFVTASCMYYDMFGKYIHCKREHLSFYKPCACHCLVWFQLDVYVTRHSCLLQK